MNEMDKPDESCYFWMDSSVPEEDRTMSVMCVPCHDTKYPDLGWFWDGENKGYGPFNIICDICGKLIHAGPESEGDANASY